MPTKPGWTTTEWWTTLLAHAVAVVALVHPGFVAPQWTAAFAALAAEIGAAGYSYSRAHVKASAATTAPSPVSPDKTVAATLRQAAAALDPTP